MLKYLLHSSKSTFDATTNRYTYTLDRKLGGFANRIVLAAASFNCATNIDPLPHVVYMRSDALSRIIRSKHTVELVSDSHDNATNVIAVLTETHTRGVPSG